MLLFTKLLTEATAFAKAIGKRDKAVVALLNEAKTALETVDENGWTIGPEDNEERRARQLETARNLGAALGKINSVIQTLSNGIGPSDIEGSN
jgi:hypothetical protein